MWRYHAFQVSIPASIWTGAGKGEWLPALPSWVKMITLVIPSYFECQKIHEKMINSMPLNQLKVNASQAREEILFYQTIPSWTGGTGNQRRGVCGFLTSASSAGTVVRLIFRTTLCRPSCKKRKFSRRGGPQRSAYRASGATRSPALVSS